MDARSARRTVRLTAGLVLLCGCAAACTGSDSGDTPTRTSSGSGSPAPTATATAAPPPASVPLRVEVTHVAGALGRPARRTLERRVGRTIDRYVDAAFLGGDYPRSDFGTSFRSFTAGAARRARSDQALLTNRALGASTRSVRAARRSAYLSVLAPKGRVAGVTATVDLVLRVDRGDDPAQRVHLGGRLLLTRDHSGAWSIFGYDLSRSTVRVRGGS